MVRYAILGLLRIGGPRHGYALLKEYRTISGCQLSVGNIYRELQCLLTDERIETASNPPGADVRRTPYQITPAGIAAFDDWLGSSRSGGLAEYHDAMTLRACLVVQMEGPLVPEVLDRWRDELTIRRAASDRERRGTARSMSNGTERRFDPVPLLTGRRLKHLTVDVEFIENLRSAYRDWCTEGESRYRARNGRRASR
jgi:DNA-binding PadR family transcriptional regulator